MSALKPPRQPPVGARRTDAQGRTWVKVRRLPFREYQAALAWAVGGARTGGLSDDDVRAMGYELRMDTHEETDNGR